MPDNNSCQTTVVELTFKRIQQFLFAVPRLKAMIGANALLGEVTRNKLTQLVEDTGGAYKIPDELLEDAPGIAEDDPIKEHDNPKALYKKGVISRDGGHFTAIFKNRESSEVFIKAANKMVADKLPGIQLEAKVRNENSSDEVAFFVSNQWGKSPTRLPQFQICEDTGNRIANQPKDDQFVSKRVIDLEDAGDRFKQKKTKDIIGLLKDKLPSLDSDPRIPDNLDELAGSNGYIAVIHADGNNIGMRRKKYVGEYNNKPFDINTFIEHEIKNETFFYAMRTAVRASVIEALHKVYTKDVLQRDKPLPYHLLMLGGDDLLLITRPEFAFPFVIEYSKALKTYKVPDEEEETPISIGAGIAIAHHKVPFYHLHHLAENLASSAKKLYRNQNQERSVVDWMVASTSWIDDIESTRKQYDLSKDGTHCISAKPYFVSPKDDAKEQEKKFCLETLWECADEIQKKLRKDTEDNIDDKDKLPRSQLKAVLQPLSQFNKEVSKELYGKISPKTNKLETLFNSKSLWHNIDGKHLSQYKDLMELIELHYLGKQTQKTGDDNE